MKTQQTITVLHFMLGDVCACADIESIKKVVLLPQLEAVPGGPNDLAGLMNYEGKSVPVIDLALKLEIARQEKYSTDTPVLLCEHQGKQIGIIINKVLGFAELAPANLQLDKEFDLPNSPFFGAVNKDGKLSLLINVKNIAEESFSHHSFNTAETLEKTHD